MITWLTGADSDPSDEYPAAKTTSAKGADGGSQTMEPPPPSQDTPDPPPINQDIPAKAASHRKTGRPSTRRGRIGRNQYTQDREHHTNVNGDHDGSPLRSQSGEGAEDHPVGANSTNTMGDSGKPSKARYLNPHRTSMNEMKRRVAAILEFISRTQLEMAGEQAPSGTNGGGAIHGGSSSGALIAGLADEVRPMLALNGGGASDEEKRGSEKDFAMLSSMEMMDVLTRNLVLWQKEYGKYGEK